MQKVNLAEKLARVHEFWSPKAVGAVNDFQVRLARLKGAFVLGNLIAGIFFGLWLLPLGILVYRSGFFPRVLGLLLIAGSPGYVVLFVQAFLFPGSERTLWSNPLLVVTHLAEAAMMLWLLLRGVNVAAWKERALAST